MLLARPASHVASGAALGAAPGSVPCGVRRAMVCLRLAASTAAGLLDRFASGGAAIGHRRTASPRRRNARPPAALAGWRG
jgi:hypothetical protein